MKNPDFKQIVEQIHQRVVEKLGPYGILVEHTEPNTSGAPRRTCPSSH